MSEKFALNTSLTGTISTKNVTSHIQVSESKIVVELRQAHKVGISIVHLVARKLFTAVPASIKTFWLMIYGINKSASGLVIFDLVIDNIFQELLQISRYLVLKDIPKPRMENLAFSLLNFNIIITDFLFLRHASLKDIINYYNQRNYI
jgi:hypothetical protein